MKNDFDLKRDVLEELKLDPSVNAAEIEVTVKDGLVTLAGYVDRLPEKKWGAERAVRRVSGVKAIANQIQVRLPTFSEQTDANITRAILNALERDTFVPHDRIKVTVQDRCAILEGVVDWHFQRLSAEHVVHHVTGVKEVKNQITFKPGQTNREKIKQEIEMAFIRNTALDVGRVRAETFEGKVILRGTVRSFSDREEVERIVWFSPGVLEVRNYITLGS